MDTKVSSTYQAQRSTTSSVTENGTPIIMPGEENNKDLFLKLLVAQMQNQDPFNPQDPTQYVTQLSQFTMMEETMDLNDNIELMIGINNGLLVNSAMNGAATLIGKEVEAYAPESTEEDLGQETDEEKEKTIKGTVESVEIKDGVVYMNIKNSETNEVVSVEYAALLKVN